MYIEKKILFVPTATTIRMAVVIFANLFLRRRGERAKKNLVVITTSERRFPLLYNARLLFPRGASLREFVFIANGGHPHQRTNNICSARVGAVGGLSRHRASIHRGRPDRLLGRRAGLPVDFVASTVAHFLFITAILISRRMTRGAARRYYGPWSMRGTDNGEGPPLL